MTESNYTSPLHAGLCHIDALAGTPEDAPERRFDSAPLLPPLQLT